MAAYTVNTTAQQENILDDALVGINNRKVAAGQPTITKPQLVQLTFNDRLDDHRVQVLNERKAPIVPALDGATNTQIANIKTILGLP